MADVPEMEVTEAPEEYQEATESESADVSGDTGEPDYVESESTDDNIGEEIEEELAYLAGVPEDITDADAEALGEDVDGDVDESDVDLMFDGDQDDVVVGPPIESYDELALAEHLGWDPLGIGHAAKSVWRGTVGKGARTLSRGLKAVIKSKLTVAVAGGVALAFPPAAPAAAAVAAASIAVNQLDSKSPKKRAAAKRVIKNTHFLATIQKNVNAMRAMAELKKAQKVRLARKAGMAPTRTIPARSLPGPGVSRAIAPAPAGRRRIVLDIDQRGRISQVA